MRTRVESNTSTLKIVITGNINMQWRERERERERKREKEKDLISHLLTVFSLFFSFSDHVTID